MGQSADSTEDSVPAILLVDDHPANLVALEAVLQPLGYRMDTASSGAQALEQLHNRDYVLILMDVHMPGMDGYQTMARIREEERLRDIPVAFLTAVCNQLEHTHRGYALGAVDYISKPFDPEVLRGKVRALVLLYTRGQRAERERSQKAERMKDLFLGAVGHDLRAPLNTILLAAQLMLRGADCGSAEDGGHAMRIERAGRRMQRMIEDILDLTRSQFAGDIPLSLRPISLPELCRVVLDECRLTHPGREVHLQVSGDVAGHWDPYRLGRVVSNLVGNAVEHCSDGPVRVRVNERGQRAVLEVHNVGPPIDPGLLPTLFDPFRRGQRSANGLGLGLYIVREIVRAHHGTVEVASTPADGTTFTVTLPKMAASDALPFCEAAP
jgi:signal transduction histidine kinase